MQCRRAGIEVKVVTGDTSATAVEISRQIGVWSDRLPDGAQISGVDFEALSDEEAYQRAAVIKVMSRARPADKQRLVTMLQKRGEVVAVSLYMAFQLPYWYIFKVICMKNEWGNSFSLHILYT